MIFLYVGEFSLSDSGTLTGVDISTEGQAAISGEAPLLRCVARNFSSIILSHRRHLKVYCRLWLKVELDVG